MMFYPPSLPPEVFGRAFRANNGEIGLMPEDAASFLDACEKDGVGVLGWEFWIADHFRSVGPLQSAPGSWFGGIPVKDSALENYIHGDGNVAEIRADLPNICKYLEQVEPAWAPFVRINFTLD